MSDLDPLIRYRKHLVDEKRKFLAQLYEKVELVVRQKKVIEEQLDKERELAETSELPETITYFGRYADGARKKIKALKQSIEKMEIRIAAAQEDMRVAFADMKKIEIVRDTRAAREEAEQSRKDDQAMDETALDNYRRRLEEETK